jgi:hypothetical protein
MRRARALCGGRSERGCAQVPRPSGHDRQDAGERPRAGPAPSSVLTAHYHAVPPPQPVRKSRSVVPAYMDSYYDQNNVPQQPQSR